MATSYQHLSLLSQQENLQLPKRKVGIVQPLGMTGKGLIRGPIGNDVKIFKKKSFEVCDQHRPLGDVKKKSFEGCDQHRPLGDVKKKSFEGCDQRRPLGDVNSHITGLLKPGEKALLVSQKPPVLKQKLSQDIGQLEILNPKSTLNPPALKPPSVSEIVSTLNGGEHETPLMCLEVDAEDREDPFYCTDYVEDVHHFLKESEQNPVYIISPQFLSNQSKVTSHHRCVLIDWLVQVQRKFKLLQETLYITIDILDRYLDLTNLPRDQLQLTGVTSMLVASKYEEIYPPCIADFCYICADIYTAIQIREMERKMLYTLQYELNKPFALQFLRRYSKITNATIKEHTMAKYILEQAFLDWKLATARPSLKAAAALQLAQSILHLKDSAPNDAFLVKYTGYSEKDLREMKTRLKVCLKFYHDHKFTTIRKKYEGAQFLEVAKSPELKKSFKN